MRFVSTRGRSEPVGFFEAFAHGLAPDGGLYVPEALPSLPDCVAAGEVVPYADLAFEFLKLFDTDHAPEDLRALVDKSYANFAHPKTAPLRRLSDQLSVLELFHGPTLAFKDFGLQLVGNLFEDQIARTGQTINVLGATSGDTGSAAIHGLADKEGVNVFILYPKGRISPLQERQMTCTGAANIFPLPIEGSFDDAQSLVKELFGDLAFKNEARLSAVNSINLARVLAQSIYYLHAWLQLSAAEREDLTFVVPTGNFGNVFAGWLAQRMGLPAKRFVIATNQNDILYRLFNSGIYKTGAVEPSLAPSMDIQVASNFERFLYYLQEGDGAKVSEMMATVKAQGELEIPGFRADTFSATRTVDSGILENIANAWDRYGYVIDPHTACGFETGGGAGSGHRVVLSTAHPAKFPDTIEEAIGEHPTHPALEALKQKEQVRYEVAATAEAVSAFIRDHAA